APLRSELPGFATAVVRLHASTGKSRKPASVLYSAGDLAADALIHRDVIRVGPFAGEIGAGRDAGEPSKFVSQVCLVVVASRDRHICPLHATARGNAPQHLLEAMDPAVEFGREPDLLAKELGKAPAAQPGVAVHLSDRMHVRCPGELAQCE